MVLTRPGAAQAPPPPTNGPQRPIRWFYLTAEAVDGSRVEFGNSAVNANRTEDGNSDGYRRAARVRDPSRLRSTVQRYMMRIAVVIDSREMEGVHLGALADFISMVTLVQINPDANVLDAPTVLNLFQEGVADPPTGLTGWDYAYLDALYTSRPDARDADQQQHLIVRDMTRNGR